MRLARGPAQVRSPDADVCAMIAMKLKTLHGAQFLPMRWNLRALAQPFMHGVIYGADLRAHRLDHRPHRDRIEVRRSYSQCNEM